MSECGVLCEWIWGAVSEGYLLGDWVDQLRGRAVVDIHLASIFIPEGSTDSHICAGTSQYTLTEQQTLYIRISSIPHSAKFSRRIIFGFFAVGIESQKLSSGKFYNRIDMLTKSLVSERENCFC